MTQPPKRNGQVPLDDALGRHRDALRDLFPLPPSRPKPRKANRTAGVVLLLALAVGTLAWPDPVYKCGHFATAIGERRNVTLADGNQFLLGSGSQIEVGWYSLSRRVALCVGQVFLEISPMRYWPFVVFVNSTDIRVLGIRLNVHRLDDDVHVTPKRGWVEVGTLVTIQAPVVLLSGQQIDAIGGQLIPLAEIDAATATVWKDDHLVFERTPLGEAVVLLCHYRKTPILLDDPSLASLRLTGVFVTHSADQLLDLLPSTLPAAVSRQEDGSVEI